MHLTKTCGMLALLILVIGTVPASAQTPLPGTGPRLGERLLQADIVNGDFTFTELRNEGRRIFSTPFNKDDGYGDGVRDVNFPAGLGNRGTLQNNGTFLRVAGLDAQTCLECHAILSNATIPATLGIPGIAGVANNAIVFPQTIDVTDSMGNGFAFFDGRFINPPFLFGAGGVELVGKEMTSDLQALKTQAENNLNTIVPLVTKGVSFGTLSHDGIDFDFSGIEGIDEDLVIRQLGRKGEFPTLREFDIEAMRFHLGMRAVDDPAVGAGNDIDNDGVVDEITTGELSALHFFGATSEVPRIDVKPGAITGFLIFQSIGCANCHVPFISTDSPNLTLSEPEVLTDPSQNVYVSMDLRQDPMNFPPSFTSNGVAVIMFADLKRHDMGPDLAESTPSPLASQFTTARLWGVADTAPYLHDGRALTIHDAILMHGGEAATARAQYAALTTSGQRNVLQLLRSLRVPVNPGDDLPAPEER